MKIKISLFEKYLLSTLLFLVLLRVSEIGWGLPNLQSELGSIDYTLTKVIQVLVLFGLLIYFSFLPRELLKLKVNSYLLTITFLIVFLSILFSEQIALSARFLLSVIVASLPIIIYARKFGVDKLFTFIKLFSYGVFVLSVLYIIIFPHYGISAGVHDGAFRGMFPHKNTFGFFCVIVFAFLINDYIVEKHFIKKALLSLMVITCSFIIFKTNSSTTLLASIFGISTFIALKGLFSINNINTRLGIFIFFLLFAFVGLTMFYVNLEYIVSLFGKDLTFSGRTGLWEVLWSVNLNSPYFGYGIGLFNRPEIMHQYTTEFGWAAKSTHNSYLSLSLGIGFIGTITLLVYILNKIIMSVVIQNLNKTKQSQLSSVIVMMVACLGFGISESGMLLTPSFSWTIMLFSLCYFAYFKKTYG